MAKWSVKRGSYYCIQCGESIISLVKEDDGLVYYEEPLLCPKCGKKGEAVEAIEACLRIVRRVEKDAEALIRDLLAYLF